MEMAEMRALQMGWLLIAFKRPLFVLCKPRILFSNYTYHLLSLTSLCMLFICNSFPIKAYTGGSSNSSRWKSLTHSYTCKNCYIIQQNEMPRKKAHSLNQENQALLSKLKKNFPTQAPVLQQILSNQTRPDIR